MCNLEIVYIQNTWPTMSKSMLIIVKIYQFNMSQNWRMEDTKWTKIGFISKSTSRHQDGMPVDMGKMDQNQWSVFPSKWYVTVPAWYWQHVIKRAFPNDEEWWRVNYESAKVDLHSVLKN